MEEREHEKREEGLAKERDSARLPDFFSKSTFSGFPVNSYDFVYTVNN